MATKLKSDDIPQAKIAPSAPIFFSKLRLQLDRTLESVARVFPRFVSAAILFAVLGLVIKYFGDFDPRLAISVLGPELGERFLGVPLMSAIAFGPLLVFAALIVYAEFKFFENSIPNRRPGTQEDEALRSRYERQSTFEIESLRRDFRQRAQQEADSYIKQYVASDLRRDVDRLISKRISEELKLGTVRALAKELQPVVLGADRQEKLIQFLSETLLNTRARILESAEKSDRSALIFRNVGLVLMIGGLVIAILRVFGFQSAADPALTDLMKSNPLLYVFLANGPVIGLILFVEFLALLFFRLYRRSEEQLKYFSNEAVNLDLRFAAANSAIYKGETKDISRVIQEFAATDRNPILSRGQQTMAHLHGEAEKDDLRDALALFTAATAKTKSNGAKAASAARNAKK